MIKITEHAKKRMLERGITEASIKLALSHPIGDLMPGKNGTIIRRGHGIGGIIIKIYLSADNKTVITVAKE